MTFARNPARLRLLPGKRALALALPLLALMLASCTRDGGLSSGRTPGSDNGRVAVREDGGNGGERREPGAGPDTAQRPEPQRRAPEPYSGPVKVGILLPLSGPNAELGQAMMNAAQMAVFDVGAENFELLPRDTQGTAEGARRAASEVRQQGADLILGPLFAPSVAAIKPIMQRYDMRAIAFSTDWTLAGDSVYIMGFLPFTQVARVATYAQDQGVRRIGALLPDDAYGDAVLSALRRSVGDGGNSELVAVRRYDPEAEDLSPIVREFANFDQRKARLEGLRRELSAGDDEASQRALKRLEAYETQGELPYDAVFLGAGGAALRRIAPLLPFFDLDPRRVRMLGTGLWDDPRTWRESALLGGWYAAPAPGLRSDFEKRYKQTYGQAPQRLSTLAYDATALAAKLGRYGPGGRPAYDHETLTSANGFIGLDGIFRFRDNGLVQRGLAVLEIGQGRARVIDNPPRTFRRVSF